MPSLYEDWETIFRRAIDGYRSETASKSVSYDSKRLCTYMQRNPEAFASVLAFVNKDENLGWLTVKSYMSTWFKWQTINQRMIEVPHEGVKGQRTGGKLFAPVPVASVTELR